MKNITNSNKSDLPRLGLDVGTFAVKGVLTEGRHHRKVTFPTEGNPVKAAQKCVNDLLEGIKAEIIYFGITGANASLLAKELGVRPFLEIEVLQAGLVFKQIESSAVLSLGHENMHYLEFDSEGKVIFYNRNSQCAAGSGAFWYQQATRMGYDDRQLAEVALEANAAVKISGRCAVFAKSDMTHAINEGATQADVSAGMAKALVDTVLTSIAQNRIKGPGTLAAVGGVVNNKAIMKHIKEYCSEHLVEINIPGDHEYLNALGASLGDTKIRTDSLCFAKVLNREYVPENPLPPLDYQKVKYMESSLGEDSYDLSTVYLGVDCGSVSTKCVLLDAVGSFIGGVYLSTAGRPALQVLELMKRVNEKYGHLIDDAHIIACTTGSGRFLSQKILSAEYAVDEITCQAEGVKYLCGEEGVLSVIEIGGEDSKFLQLRDGVLYDYNMNPVCAAGTGTFLENLAGLLGVQIEEEFSQKAFNADYAIDLGDICTLLSQSVLISAASRGLPLSSQLASLAYSSARNYLSKTVENRPLEGKVIFTGATAKNHALASAFAAECGAEIIIPPYPELSGALGSALVAKIFYSRGQKGKYSFRNLQNLHSFTVAKHKCKADCEHEHNCTLDRIKFGDGSSFFYGDRCGQYSGLDKSSEDYNLPAYKEFRNKSFYESAGEPLTGGLRVGIARGGLFFEFYPFWAAFFRELGVEVVLSSETNDDILEKGKRELDSDMCYPLKVIVGHYQELVEMELDFIFLPEVVDMESLPWAEDWPRSFTCPLLQTIKGVVVNSLELDEDKLLYAQLNYRSGKKRITSQMEPVAKKILGADYDRAKLINAVEASYQAQETFHNSMVNKSHEMMEELKEFKDDIAAVFLGRSYTTYDDFVSKESLDYARQRGLVALPQDFILAYLAGWYKGEIQSSILDDTDKAEFNQGFNTLMKHMDNIYPAQLQNMLSCAFFVKFLNERNEKTGLPLLNIILQDPFKCGPNAMLRHYLNGLAGFLRLTLDEHTAPAGMITRLEAFKNTCRSRKSFLTPAFYSARTKHVKDEEWNKILIVEPTPHTRVFAAMFRNYGVDAEVLPQSKDSDLTLARRFVNGEECLPFIQNVQDFLEYLYRQNGDFDIDKTVIFQGWACGPCRYGLYAPTQSLVINKAGFGEGRICAVKLDDCIRRFGINFVVGMYNGMLATDLLYKMLYSTRPYELKKGASETLFKKYSGKLFDLLESYRFSLTQIVSGKHLRPLEILLKEAVEEFTNVPRSQERRPHILLGGEFYVRLDDRSNQEIIKKIEEEGGEVSLAPATELFSYTAYIMYREFCDAFETKKSIQGFLMKSGYSLINQLAHRDELRLSSVTAELLHDHEEPSPKEIMRRAKKYVSEHYGGEPPMTIGRISALASRNGVGGAILVAPFTCMPASVVEAQMGALQEELGLPMITLYYDGKENANREKFIESLVFQAKQKVGLV